MNKLTYLWTVAFVFAFSLCATDAMAASSWSIGAFIDGFSVFFGNNSGGSSSGSDVFSTAYAKAIEAFVGVKYIVFILGGFGLIGLAFFAIFGRIHWKWFAGLLVGLAAVAAAGMIVDYATGSGIELGDTFITTPQ